MERVYIANKEVIAEPQGVYFMRGDNVAVISEIDAALEQNIDYGKIKAPPIKPMLLH